MSDHDFEKQVHQKLEELKLRPSDGVWMEVEKNIRQDKRRRRVLWLWMAALLISVTTSGVVLYYHTSGTGRTLDMAGATPATLSNEPANVSTNSTFKETTPHDSLPENASLYRNMETVPAQPPIENDQPGSIPAAPPVTGLPIDDQPAIAVPQNEINKETSKETIGSTYKKPVKQRIARDGYQPPVETVTEYSHENRIVRKKKTVQPVISEKENGVEPAPITVAEPVEPTVALTGTMPALATDADHSIATGKAVADSVNSPSLRLLLPDSTAGTTAAALPIPRKQPRLWHWGIVTDAGFSQITESKFLQLRGLLGQAKSLDMVNSSVRADNNSLFNLSYSATKKASPIQPDLSFSVGVFVQRAVSRRLTLSVGLEYAYMSVNTQVGQKINAPLVINTDTASAIIVDEFYKLPGYTSPANFPGGSNSISAGSYQQGATYYSQTYRYRFQYLEMPVLINWQINKGRRMPPIVFEGGVSIARLLSADALQFESVKGVYYEDNSVFNKTRFNFVTGLSVGLLQHSKHPVWIGPTLRYGLNGMIKNDVANKQYLWSTGINVKILLGKL